MRCAGSAGDPSLRRENGSALDDGCVNGGASRARTDGLVVANDALSQLSYSPTKRKLSTAKLFYQRFVVRSYEGDELILFSVPMVREESARRCAPLGGRGARPSMVY